MIYGQMCSKTQVVVVLEWVSIVPVQWHEPADKFRQVPTCGHCVDSFDFMKNPERNSIAEFPL